MKRAVRRRCQLGGDKERVKMAAVWRISQASTPALRVTFDKSRLI